MKFIYMLIVGLIKVSPTCLSSRLCSHSSILFTQILAFSSLSSFIQSEVAFMVSIKFSLLTFYLHCGANVLQQIIVAIPPSGQHKYICKYICTPLFSQFNSLLQIALSSPALGKNISSVKIAFLAVDLFFQIVNPLNKMLVPFPTQAVMTAQYYISFCTVGCGIS